MLAASAKQKRRDENSPFKNAKPGSLNFFRGFRELYLYGAKIQTKA
jgi:hypothetical protein